MYGVLHNNVVIKASVLDLAVCQSQVLLRHDFNRLHTVGGLAVQNKLQDQDLSQYIHRLLSILYFFLNNYWRILLSSPLPLIVINIYFYYI